MSRKACRKVVAVWVAVGIKTPAGEAMVGSRPQKLRSTLFWGILRVVAVTILVTLIGFAVTLFFSIAGVLIATIIKGGGLNMALAYRNIALPIALGVLVVAFFVALAMEIRDLRTRSASHGASTTARDTALIQNH
jgi:hypothetical protein